MGAIDDNALEFEAIFISIKEVIDLLLKDNQKEPIKNTINARFFSNQTCLVCDGYDVEIIKIDKNSNPSYYTFKDAIADYLDRQTEQPLLSDYGFSKQRTLNNLINFGVVISDELLLNAKSFNPHCDDDNLDLYLDCLPDEYKVLHENHEQLKQETAKLRERMAELEKKQANSTPATELKGIYKVNYDSKQAKKFACIIAKSIWSMDNTEQIRTGDMVQYVQSLLLEFNPNALPETNTVVGDWLADVKPDYASKAGKPPKDAPNEIPLTFKK